MNLMRVWGLLSLMTSHSLNIFSDQTNMYGRLITVGTHLTDENKKKNIKDCWCQHLQQIYRSRYGPFSFLKWIQNDPHWCISLQPDCCTVWLTEVNNNDGTEALRHGDHILIIVFAKLQRETATTSKILFSWNPTASLLSLRKHTHTMTHCGSHWCALATVFNVVSSFCYVHTFWTTWNWHFTEYCLIACRLPTQR